MVFFLITEHTPTYSQSRVHVVYDRSGPCTFHVCFGSRADVNSSLVLVAGVESRRRQHTIISDPERLSAGLLSANSRDSIPARIVLQTGAPSGLLVSDYT